MINQRFLFTALTSTLALLFHITAPAQSVNRSKTIKEIDSLRKQLSEKEELFLLPSAEDKAAFAEFLKQPGTGLIRLLPRGLYEDMFTMRGGGAFYSFARLTHEYGFGSDIELRPVPANDFAPSPIGEYTFHTGFAGVDYGFIVTLGDVPLEKVSLDHDGVKFLVAYHRPLEAPEARIEKKRAYDGIWENGYEYKNDTAVIENYTYALRSIYFDKSDVLVAFRVARKEKDGSVMLLWKMLKRFSRPELAR
jgi:hypothetical protein